MKIKILFHSLVLFTAFYALTGCGDQPLFDELATNRIKVVIKGTYESNNPRPWDKTNSFNDDLDSVYIYTSSPVDVKPNRFMLDLAGISVSSGKHKQYFANYRETHVALINDGVANDPEPFFNNDGIIYENDDVRPGFVWQNVNVYIRKMLFDNAKRYPILNIEPTGNTWGTPENVIDLFHEDKVEGFNFNLAQVLSYSDSLRMNYLQVNRIFPLVIPVEDGFVFNNKDSDTVLEIRLVVKNFTKKYEYEYVDADKNHKLIHYYALSDWLRNVRRNEPAPTSDTSGIIGGNLLAVARYYVPGKVAKISGSSTSDCFVVAVKAGSISQYQFNLATRTRPAAPVNDIPKIPRMPVLVANPNSTQVTNYLETLLQYYLQYETYKANYDIFANNVNSGSGVYESLWNDYDSDLNAFKIPPLVTWASSGAYLIQNVPAGTYDIHSATASIGSLPDTFSPVLATITITESDFNSPIPVGGPTVP